MDGFVIDYRRRDNQKGANVIARGHARSHAVNGKLISSLSFFKLARNRG
jgi:hypothetical protein